MAANVAVAEPDLIGRIIAAWSSFALTASYELLTRQVRRSASAGDSRARCEVSDRHSSTPTALLGRAAIPEISQVLGRIGTSGNALDRLTLQTPAVRAQWRPCPSPPPHSRSPQPHRLPTVPALMPVAVRCSS